MPPSRAAKSSQKEMPANPSKNKNKGADSNTKEQTDVPEGKKRRVSNPGNKKPDTRKLDLAEKLRLKVQKKVLESKAQAKKPAKNTPAGIEEKAAAGGLGKGTARADDAGSAGGFKCDERLHRVGKLPKGAVSAGCDASSGPNGGAEKQQEAKWNEIADSETLDRLCRGEAKDEEIRIGKDSVYAVKPNGREYVVVMRTCLACDPQTGKIQAAWVSRQGEYGPRHKHYFPTDTGHFCLDYGKNIALLEKKERSGLINRKIKTVSKAPTANLIQLTKITGKDETKKRSAGNAEKRLLVLNNKKKRLEALEEVDPLKALQVAEKEKWDMVIGRSAGEKVITDVAKLQKKVRNMKRIKRVSKRKWEERTLELNKKVEERAKKRRENINNRKKQRLDKKMGIKPKKTSKPPKKKSDKKARPGFEG